MSKSMQTRFPRRVHHPHLEELDERFAAIEEIVTFEERLFFERIEVLRDGVDQIGVGDVLRYRLIGAAPERPGDQAVEPMSGFLNGYRTAGSFFSDGLHLCDTEALDAGARRSLVENPELLEAVENDVITPIRQPIGMGDEARTPNRIHRRLIFVLSIPPWPQHHHTDKALAFKRVADHRAISRLENVEGQQRGGEQHHVRQRKQRNL